MRMLQLMAVIACVYGGAVLVVLNWGDSWWGTLAAAVAVVVGLVVARKEYE